MNRKYYLPWLLCPGSTAINASGVETHKFSVNYYRISQVPRASG
jgi:hypothetical protein